MVGKLKTVEAAHRESPESFRTWLGRKKWDGDARALVVQGLPGQTEMGGWCFGETETEILCAQWLGCVGAGQV